ncbi:MAG TPA: N-acetyltransferase [Desulfobacterales bacterium]|nr:N-acetyltransferase [Desulfobacterales bacterium]HIP40719.1 N-acetyltransferase [Desulfocapsa sulfexigens]
MIRNARMGDVKTIHSLLNHFADKGLLLGRSYSALYDQLRDFKVFTDSEERLLGVCALHISWEDLAEIRSLAVHEDAQGKNIGKKLVRACLEEANHFGIDKVFTLTYQAGFFRKQGFVDIDKNKLPHKIWSDCMNCPKFPDCDEEALQCSVAEVLKDS